MTRMFETGEITKLLDVLIGKTEAVGETNEDERRLDNLKTLIDVTNWCLDGLQFAMASGCGRPEYSMAEISYTAQCALDEYGRWIADVLDEQIADRKTEPTISKMEQVDKDETQTNADQHVQRIGSVESVEPTWTKEEHEAFYTFLWNVINPNEMQDYIGMFETKDEPQTSKIIEAYAKGYEDGADAVKAMPSTECRMCKHFKDRPNCGWECEYDTFEECNYEPKDEKTERPQGEWKPKNHHTDYCSNCGFEETQWRTADYNFCPSCGARMKGVDDEHTV